MQNFKVKTQLKKCEARKLGEALAHLEQVDMDTKGYVSEQTQALCSKIRPQIKEALS